MLGIEISFESRVNMVTVQKNRGVIGSTTRKNKICIRAQKGDKRMLSQQTCGVFFAIAKDECSALAVIPETAFMSITRQKTVTPELQTRP